MHEHRSRMIPVPEQEETSTRGTRVHVAVVTATTSLAVWSYPFRRYGTTNSASDQIARGDPHLLVRRSVQGIGEGRSKANKQHNDKAKATGLEIH